MNTYNNFKMPSCPKDQGLLPYVTDLENAVSCNNDFRRAFWTGNFQQMTLMSIAPGSDIGLECHPNLEQFLYIVSGCGYAVMGTKKEHLDYRNVIAQGSGIFIPENTWHNIINTSNCPLKLFSIYAPPNHPYGTIQHTKADAEHSHT